MMDTRCCFLFGGTSCYFCEDDVREVSRNEGGEQVSTGCLPADHIRVCGWSSRNSSQINPLLSLVTSRGTKQTTLPLFGSDPERERPRRRPPTGKLGPKVRLFAWEGNSVFCKALGGSPPGVPQANPC